MQERREGDEAERDGRLGQREPGGAEVAREGQRADRDRGGEAGDQRHEPGREAERGMERAAEQQVLASGLGVAGAELGVGERAGDGDEPARTLPRALFGGTALVTAVYLLLNAVFVLAAPLEAVRGETAIAERVVASLAGPGPARALSGLVAFGLVSTVGAFVLSGARVHQAMAADHPRLAWLGRTNARGAPVVALAVQAGLAMLLVLVSTLRDLLGGVGMALSLTSALTIVALFAERRRRPPVFAAPGHPYVPLVYLGLVGWVLVGGALSRPDLFALSLATLGLGALGYVVFREKTA